MRPSVEDGLAPRNKCALILAGVKEIRRGSDL